MFVVMGVGRIFFQGEGALGAFSKIFLLGSKVVKFVFSYSKLRKLTFLVKFSNSFRRHACGISLVKQQWC